jgi:hypothetical protein
MDTNLGAYLEQQKELELLLAVAEGKIDFTMESVMDYFSFFNHLTNAVKNSFKFLFNIHTTADMLSPKAPGSTLLAILEQRGINALRTTQVYRLPKQTASMSELSTVLDNQFMAMHNITERLYTPTTKWAKRVITDSEFAERVWIDRDMSLVDVEPFVKQQADLFKPTARRNEDSEFVEFIALYPTVNEYRKAYDQIVLMHEHLSNFDLENLKKAEKELVEMFEKVIRMSRDPEEEFVMPQATKVALAKVFRNIVTETEYLVALAFQMNTVIGAWNNTVDKLKADYM